MSRAFELKPGKPLERRARLRPRSERRRREDRANAQVREAVFARDGGCVLQRFVPHHCYGGLTLQHVKRAGQGGGYTEANGKAVCAWGNTEWIPQHPEEARLYGLHKWSWEK